LALGGVGVWRGDKGPPSGVPGRHHAAEPWRSPPPPSPSSEFLLQLHVCSRGGWHTTVHTGPLPNVTVNPSPCQHSQGHLSPKPPRCETTPPPDSSSKPSPASYHLAWDHGVQRVPTLDLSQLGSRPYRPAFCTRLWSPPLSGHVCPSCGPLRWPLGQMVRTSHGGSVCFQPPAQPQC
jgi:hypothetical protein